MHFLQLIGIQVLVIPRVIGSTVLLLIEIQKQLFYLLSGRYQKSLFIFLRKQTLLQVWFTAAQLIPLMGLITLAGSYLIVGIGYQTLQTFGAEEILPALLHKIILGELLPLGIALIVIARSTPAVTADVATQVINGEIDVLKSHNMSYELLVASPRLLGLSLSLLVIQALSTLSLIIGTLLWAPVVKLPTKKLIEIWLAGFAPTDLMWITSKTLLFGLLIGTVACYSALNVKRDLREIPKASSKAVVLTLFGVFVLDAALTFIWWVL